jgi:hypothetical protein
VLAAPVLKAFMQRGGVVVVLPGGRDLSRAGLLPFDVDMTEIQNGDEGRGSAAQLVDAASPLAKRPNVIDADDLASWGGDRSWSR